LMSGLGCWLGLNVGGSYPAVVRCHQPLFSCNDRACVDAWPSLPFAPDLEEFEARQTVDRAIEPFLANGPNGRKPGRDPPQAAPCQNANQNQAAQEFATKTAYRKINLLLIKFGRCFYFLNGVLFLQRSTYCGLNPPPA
jgi:hypothetical protein